MIKEGRDLCPSDIVKGIKLRRTRVAGALRVERGNSETEDKVLKTLSGGQILLCNNKTFAVGCVSI
jgi:hypothetical protein